MKRFIALFCIIVVVVFSDFVFAGSCKFVTFPIPLMVESADKGVFIQLTKEIGKRSGLDITIKVLPTKRAVHEFNNAEFDGFFPGLDVMFNRKISPSMEIYIKEDYAFTRKESSLVSTMEGLNGKTIGITLGYPYAKKIIGNKSLKFENANSDLINMKKLSAGRIDVFIVEEKSGLKALDLSKVTNIVYPEKKPLSKQKVYYAFQPDEQGKQFALKISAALLSMKKDGTFGKIMSMAK